MNTDTCFPRVINPLKVKTLRSYGKNELHSESMWDKLLDMHAESLLEMSSKRSLDVTFFHIPH